jgi:uncharacterized protein
VADASTIDALREFFARDPHGCMTVYLFGSRARDDYRESSDVDVAVLWERVPEDPMDALGLGLKVDLEDLLQREVDVVVLNRASVDVAQRVIRDGVIILDRDRAARIRWEVDTRTEFLELLPALLEYRRMKP